jgi:hypothetical protein
VSTVYFSSVQENEMKRRLAVRRLMLTMARLVVVGAMLWMAHVAFAEQTVTVYIDPT